MDGLAKGIHGLGGGDGVVTEIQKKIIFAIKKQYIKNIQTK